MNKKIENNSPKKKEKIKKLLIDFVFVASGCALTAFATIGILIPNGLSTGGLTGIVKIANTFIPANFSIVYYIAALLILVICRILLGGREARKIIMMAILYPAFLILFEKIDISLLEKKDMFLAATYYGVISGLGIGLIFKRGYSFGGTDTIAKIIHTKVLPFVSISQILLVIDAIIIILSGYLYGRNVAMYALVSQIIFVNAIDFILYGFDSKFEKLEIISNKYEDIEQYILNEVRRGSSRIEIVGSFSGEKKVQIHTVCSQRESMLIKAFIAKVDKEAFVNAIHVDSAWGRG